jgi:erythromycin esterase
MHRLLELAESDTWDFGDTTASEFRDKCIADNLIEQRRIHDPDVVLLTAHNGHISRSRPMAGWHLRKAAGLDYFSLGIAFGVGSFNAGTARGGGFHPELKVFPADHPPEGSLEALLAAVGFSSFVVDLRHFRGTDHDLAYDMTCREVSLAGGAPQFELHAPPAEMYDGLIWLDRISPTTILREAGDFW